MVVKFATPKLVYSQTKALFLFVINDRAGAYVVIFEPASIPFIVDIGSRPLPTPPSILISGTELPLKFQTVCYIPIP